MLEDELQVRVDDAPPALTLVGFRVHDSPDGVDKLELPGPANPLIEPAEIWAVPACPARKLTVLGEEESPKSAGRNSGPPT